MTQKIPLPIRSFAVVKHSKSRPELKNPPVGANIRWVGQVRGLRTIQV
jgi:hypothetical protein